MSKFSQLLDTIQASNQPGSFTVEIDDTWMQGRTTFGGLTAALIIHAIQKSVAADRLPRSLSVNFIGPVSQGQHEIKVRALREGGSVSHFQGEMVCNGEVAVSLSVSFGKSRESRLKITGPSLPPVSAFADTSPMPKREGAPGFLQHFDLRFVSGAPPFSGADEADFSLWLGFKDDTPSNLAALVALGDVPPMPGLNMMKPPGAGSSLSWYLEFPNHLSEDTQPLFYDYKAQSGANGYFNNYATIWAADGTPVMYSRQVATLFEK